MHYLRLLITECVLTLSQACFSLLISFQSSDCGILCKGYRQKPKFSSNYKLKWKDLTVLKNNLKTVEEIQVSLIKYCKGGCLAVFKDHPEIENRK